MNRRVAVTRLRETSVADLSPPVARKAWQTGGGDLATKLGEPFNDANGKRTVR